MNDKKGDKFHWFETGKDRRPVLFAGTECGNSHDASVSGTGASRWGVRNPKEPCD